MTRSRRLAIVAGLNVALVAVLIMVGVAAHSLGVLAAGADYLTDAAAIGVSLLAVRVSGRHPRAVTVAAGVNGAWLLVLSLLIVSGGVARLVSDIRPVSGLPVLIVSGLAAAVMTAGAIVLHNDDESPDLNMRAVLLDTAADAATAAGVAVTGAVILAADGWYWLDPAVALAISLIVTYHVVKLLRDVARTWRRGVP